MTRTKYSEKAAKDLEKIYKLYEGSEKFIDRGVETEHTMLDFWRWTLSCIYESTTRGGFAEFIVKIALDDAGVKKNPSGKTGMDPYDLDGPNINSTKKPSKIEVKCTSRYHLNQIKGLVPTKTQQFGIGKRRVVDEATGDYPDDAPKKRNNDIYVFVIFNGESIDDSFFDLSLWDFYVLPTKAIDNDPVYKDRANISLKAVQERCRKLAYEELAEELVKVCDCL